MKINGCSKESAKLTTEWNHIIYEYWGTLPFNDSFALSETERGGGIAYRAFTLTETEIYTKANT